MIRSYLPGSDPVTIAVGTIDVEASTVPRAREIAQRLASEGFAPQEVTVDLDSAEPGTTARDNAETVAVVTWICTFIIRLPSIVRDGRL